MILSQNTHIIPVLAPVADFGAGGFDTDIVSMKNASHLTFLVVMGANAGGAQTFTVEASDDVSASNTAAIAFNYKVLLGTADPVSTDVWGALTAATSSGVLMSTAAYQTFAIEVDASVVQAEGYEFVKLVGAETTNAAILGGVYAILSGLRHHGDTMPTAIV